MARYFFHLHDGVDTLLDPEGRELDADQVVAAVLGEARAMIAADVLGGRINLDQRIEVKDSAGKVVHQVAFQDAVEVFGARPSVH